MCSAVAMHTASKSAAEVRTSSSTSCTTQASRQYTSCLGSLLLVTGWAFFLFLRGGRWGGGRATHYIFDTPDGLNIALVVLSLHVCFTDVMDSSPTRRKSGNTQPCIVNDETIFLMWRSKWAAVKTWRQADLTASTIPVPFITLAKKCSTDMNVKLQDAAVEIDKISSKRSMHVGCVVESVVRWCC